MTLTVGQVSAIIAAVIFVFQFLVPNAITLILVGILRQTHSAVTWSVVQRNIFSSHWPLLTRSDAISTRGVDQKVRFITLLKPIGLFLISLAAVITPLGLRDNIVPTADTGQVAFGYLPDTGPFGYSSMPRNGQHFTRLCSDFNVPLPCPGSKTQINFTYNDIGEITNGTVASGTTYDVEIPQPLIDLYQSGLSTQNASVASFFDIESRLYTSANFSDTNNGQMYIVQAFKMLQSIILDETIRPIEGLIVDVKDGGIGFRNHSVPTDVDLGAEWTEDLLFIEPETECVSLNVTYEFNIGGSGDFDPVTHIALVDEGGFVNLEHTYPTVDLSDPQKNANLRDRAYKAAWITNVLAMLYMNVTRPAPNSWAYLNTTLGKRFPLDRSLTTHASATSVTTTSSFEELISPLSDISNSSSSFGNYSSLSNYTVKQLYSNPFHITTSNYSTISTICQGAGGLDDTNATNIHVECGLVFGAARPADGSPPSIVPVPYTRYRQPIYACASVSKASIKEVTFHYNTSSTRDISSLSVRGIADKVYPDETSMPRWGVETVNYSLAQLKQLWGLISDENANAPNMTSFKAPFMRLPGFYTELSTTFGSASYMPGHNGPSQALSSIYDGVGDIYDWTGASSIAMMQRWRQLTNSTDGAAHIANLIWTDLAANIMTSSKNWNRKAVQMQKRETSETPPTSDSRNYATVPVTKFKHRIQYRWPFAIPAFIVLTLAAVIVVTAIVLSVVKHAGLHHVRYYTDSLSSGRLLAAAQYPSAVDKLAPTKLWVNSAGKYQTSLGPRTYSQYQQVMPPPPPLHPFPPQHQPYNAHPYFQPAPNQFMPSAMYQGAPPPNPDYQTTYAYGGYQQAPISDISYVGANAAWAEKGHELVRSAEEIPLTPISDSSRTSRRGYVRVNNS